MRLTANKIAGILRQNGYRLTPQRHAVIRAIAASHDHATTAELHARVQQDHPEIGLATVYRVVNLLVRLKLICRVNMGSDTQSYMMRRPLEHHHHLICVECGQTVDFTNCDLLPLQRQLAHDTGFAVEGHLLEFYGRCPECCASSA